MSYTLALLILGVPTILWLAVRAARRMHAIRKRIAEVQADMARNPQSPYMALAELYQSPDPQERPHVKKHD